MLLKKPRHFSAWLYLAITQSCHPYLRSIALYSLTDVPPMLIITLGPVTDFSATFTKWKGDWAPSYKGGYTGEAERPSASYIVDVGNFHSEQSEYVV